MVADEIRAIRASGLVPSQKYVVKHRPDLYGAAQRLCGGFRLALLAAGEDPVAVASSSRSVSSAKKTIWTRAAILSRISERQVSGLSLNVDAVRRDGLGALLRAARREFGSYKNAVNAVGIDYSKIRLIAVDWVPEAVIVAIAQLAKGGRDLNVSAVQHENSSLVTAAIKFFGSWDAALREGGFDPKNIRLDVDTEAGKGRVFENLCDALFSELRPDWRLDFRFPTESGPLLPDAYDPSRDEWIDFKLAAWGMSVNSSIRKYAPYSSSLRFITLNGLRPSKPKITFQSVFDFEVEATTKELHEIFEILRALKADAVPSTKLAIWSRVWTKQKLLEFVQQLPSGKNNSLYVQRHHRREYAATVRQFGGWTQALEAAGLSADNIRRRRLAYTRDDIDQFIQARVSTGEGLSAKEVTATPSGNGIYQAADRFYGGWDRALVANNVAPNTVSAFTLSKQVTLARLLQFIRSRHAAAEPLNAQLIRDNYKAEYGVALRLCGGWRQAVEASGIKYSDISSNVPPTRIAKTDIDNYITTRFRAGLPLNTAAVMADNRPIHTAACRTVYGSWKAAIEANGIQYSQVAKK